MASGEIGAATTARARRVGRAASFGPHTRRAAIALAGVVVLSVGGPGLRLAASADSPHQPPKEQPPPSSTVKIDPPAGLYPPDRGKPQYQYFDGRGLVPPLPGAGILDAFSVAKSIPDLGILPKLNPRDLLPNLPVSLPTLPQLPSLTDVLAQLLQQLGAEVQTVQHTVQSIGGGVGAAGRVSVNYQPIVIGGAPAANEAAPCSSATYTIVVAATQAVQLHASGGPPGGTQTITPYLIGAPGGTATLTQTAPCGTPTGTYGLTVIATGTQVSANSSFPLELAVVSQSSVPQSPATYSLSTTDYANGATQQFTIPLCVPTPINAVSGNVLSPTTIVSVCPIPLALTSHLMTPPPGQPAQLYLSVQQIPGTASFPASFKASYSIPGSMPLTVTFTADSGSGANYPADAIVGAATDGNPVTGQTAQHVTMGWATDGWEQDLAVSAQGSNGLSGDVNIEQVPSDTGAFALSYENGKFTGQLTNASAWSGSTPTIVVDAQIPNTNGQGSARLTWSNLPQDFTYNLTPEIPANGQPNGFQFDGSQTQQPNAAFANELDLFTSGTVTGKYIQTGFGSQFSESVQLTRDQSGSITGIDLKSDPGAWSAIQLYDYQSGQPAALLELAGVSASTSEVAVNLQGGASSAAAGVTFSGTNAPQFIGVDSYFTSLTAGTVSSAAQSSIAMTQFGAKPSIPVAIASGVQAAMTVDGLDPNFQIAIGMPTSGGGTGGTGSYEFTGSTPDRLTAQHVTVLGQMDPTHRVTLVMNQLGQQWDFKVTPHGTSSSAAGADFSDTNTPFAPAEYKEIMVSDNAGGSYQPEFTFILQRTGSDVAGAITPGGAVMTVMDPPGSFAISVDASLASGSGSCSGQFNVTGADPNSSGGYVTLSEGGESVAILNEFVEGQWQVSGTFQGQGALLQCTPDQASISVHQGLGANPTGQLVVTVPATGIGGGTAQVSLSGFATTTDLSMSLTTDASGSPIGFSISGSNSESNPSLQIALDLLNGSSLAYAVNIASGAVNGPSGSFSFDATNVPQSFSVSAQYTQSATSSTVQINAGNPSPQPNERITASGPAPNPLASGDTAELMIQALDTSSSVRIVFSNANSLEVDSSNANPNPDEAIVGAVLAGQTVAFRGLFYGNRASLSGLPGPGYADDVTWAGMPQTFGLGLTAPQPTGSGGIQSGSFSFTISSPQAEPSSTLTFDAWTNNAHAAVYGTGTNQQFAIQFSRDDPSQAASVEAKGNLPSGFNNLQLYSISGSPYDSVFTVYRGGFNSLQTTADGTAFEIAPRAGQTSFDVDAAVNGRNTSISSTADQAGQLVSIAQYYQDVGGYSYCPSNGLNYPCNSLSLARVPMKASLALEAPTANQQSGAISYSGSDDNLNVYLQSLVPTLGGIFQDPALPNGFNMAYTFDPQNGLAFQAYAGGKNLNSLYLSGWNVNLSLNQNRTCTITMVPNVNFTATVNAALNYNATLTVRADYGVTWIKMLPAYVACNEGAEYTGTEGLRVDGSPSAKASFGVDLGRDPGWNTLHWNWSVGPESDSAEFYWYTSSCCGPNYSGVASFYGWEALKGDARKWVYGSDFLNNPGCTGVQPSNGDPAEWFPSSVPFQPTFTRENNGVVLCGGRVAYYSLNPEDVAFEHCNDWDQLCASGQTRYTTAGISVGNYNGFTSDWLFAEGMKISYSADPDNLWSLSPGS